MIAGRRTLLWPWTGRRTALCRRSKLELLSPSGSGLRDRDARCDAEPAEPVWHVEIGCTWFETRPDAIGIATVQGEDMADYIIDQDDQQYKPFNERESLDGFFINLLSEEGRWYDVKNYLDTEPGLIFEYSNVGAALAAYIVERASGVAFPEFTRRHILEPLEMKSSGWSFDEVDMADHTRMYSTRDTLLPRYFLVTYPDGGLITSSTDLAKYLQELLRGKLGDGRLLNRDSYNEIFTPQYPNVKNVDGEEELPIGIFMDLQENGLIGHTGGDPGVVSYMFFDPESEVGWILIINKSITTQACYDQFRSIWDTLKKYGIRLNQ